MTVKARLGELRPTQLLYTYGVGSVVDLPHLSVMVMGIEDWDANYTRPIIETRLLDQVQRRLGPQVQSLRTPPMRDDEAEGFFMAQDDHDAVGVPVAPFPRWLRCPACGLLAPIGSGLFRLRTVPNRPDLAKYVHSGCNRRREPTVLPARFLLACESGHLDDFPWHWFVHKGQPSECRGHLELRELGVSGEAADVEVRCRNCDANRRMADAFGREGLVNLPGCRGRRPQLRDFEDEPCAAQPRTILLGASNSWFAVTLSTLFVPTATKDELATLLQEHATRFEGAEDVGTIRYLRKQGQLGAFAKYTDEQVWAALEAERAAANDDDSAHEDLKEPEWRVLSRPDPALNGADFQLTEVAVPRRYASFIERVVLAERLREVTALIGFTRIASPRDLAEEEEARGRVIARISRGDPAFVPASEVRGEGVFIQFHEERIADWVAAREAWEDRFRDAHVAWRRRRHIEPPDAGFPGIRFILIHSFAHALMRELALECGYAAASMRERIYARDPEGDKPAMAGVLIYTAAPDAEGTLGGLVRLGTPAELERHIRRALDAMALCSSDPLCADHTPDADGATLHGAACHACLFAPETSCERGNKYLDRTTLAATVCSGEHAFFKEK